ncbi:MAG TPA: 2-amino-3-carboxymuconate-6-semialdehyde decarboxylase, partial [Paenibacillaceae bacterium]|nr:2-amino-3-carboxymuconate-6-semialdehyde decarboxylase [Paenibacillaceae bacterium]
GASLIFSGIMEKLPNLKVLLAHGGGSLPYILPRMDHGWENWTHLQELISQPPSHYAKKFYYDSLVFDPVNLKYLIDKFGDQRIMLGTDYPFKMAEIPAGRILQESFHLTEEQKNRIFGLNAMEFLGLKTIQPK